MSMDLTQQTNGSPATPPSTQQSLRHRKRSSSLCALDDLSLPSPPLSPSVSISFSRDSAVTGEIPIILDFLTTSSMSSEERLFKMASLKPELPPLAKFSPMSAFFPMSDSTGTLNTISTETFSSTRPSSLCSETSQQRYSTLSISSAAYTPWESVFGLGSPTEVVNEEQPQSPKQLMPISFSMPSVQVQDYDTGQKKLGDIPNFPISACLASPSTISFESPRLNGALEEPENSASPNSLLSAPSTPDEDDKTPTQSMFLGRSTSNHEQALTQAEYFSPHSGISLTVHPSPEYDDETPTQEKFLRRQTGVERPDIGAPKEVAEVASPAGRSSLSMPISPDLDDKTPTQSMFFKRQISLEPQPQPVTKCASIRSEVVSRREEKPLPAEPIEDEPIQTTKPTGPETEEPPSPSASVPRNALSVPCLKHAQWLRDTVVELWIDQEGFRAIRPKFFLASVSSGLPYASDLYYGPSPAGTLELTEEHDPLYTTVAEFLPVSRVAHYFHHAAFDRAPTLHRITTGNDETKDYISRAASISLKDNGVFFVHGTEDHRIDATGRPLSFSGGTNNSYHPYHHNPNTGSSNGHCIGATGRIIRLNWRFEYYVSDRRPDGRSAHRGEKVITPLSFSCTPALLDRNRANKVTVLHIMKKTLLPNLIAQKLEPPDFPPVSVGVDRNGERMKMGIQTHPSVSSLASLLSASESYGYVVTHNYHNASNSYTAATVASTLSTVAKPATTATTTTTDNTRPPKPFIPPLLNPPPRPPLPHTKHRRGSHSDTTPEDFIRQQQRSLHINSAGDRNGNHERSRSAGSVPMSLGRGSGGGGGIVDPIISQEELMKMLDASSSPELENYDHRDVIRRPHSIRVEVVDNIRVTTLPAPPRHKYT